MVSAAHSLRRVPSGSPGVLEGLWPAVVGLALFSGALNVLALTGSFYMLQVYDRVLPSRSGPTLVALSLLALGLFLAYGLLDFFRGRLFSRIGAEIGDRLEAHLFTAVSTGGGLAPVRDADQLAAFFSGRGSTAILDLPWVPVYLAAGALLHPLFAVFATLALLLLVAITIGFEVRSGSDLEAAQQTSRSRYAVIDVIRRSGRSVVAHGEASRLEEHWISLSREHARVQLRASDRAQTAATIVRVVRLISQSGILALGAYLVIEGELTGGAMFAASLILSRALQPIDGVTGQWRTLARAYTALRRLLRTRALHAGPARRSVVLPPPRKSLEVEQLTILPAGAGASHVGNITFSLRAGDGLGIVGPSGSGKSSLARALAGARGFSGGSGTIRLDGATLGLWTSAARPRAVGFLPQEVTLLEGTIGQVISGFDPEAQSAAIIAAGEAAGVHDMIVRLPDGYDTFVGEPGSSFSAGFRQRLGLARALYGDPFVVVLDEPYSNLDGAAELALSEAVLRVRRRGGIVVIVAHRASALAGVDLVLALTQGRMMAFGPKDEILRRVLEPGSGRARSHANGAQAAGALKVVGEPAAGGGS